MTTPRALCVVLAAAGSGCFTDLDTAALPVTAFCEVDVIGVGRRDVESDYLPAVVACENGAASFEALKAQAVAARSYLYYRLGVDGMISDGQGDQVYTCNNPPNAEHVRAVAETSGEVLQYQGVQIAAFYVAGAFGEAPDCFGGPDDPTNTERFVTYNEGLSGDNINQTTLGFVDPSNFANRGCMSQNGGDCLSDQGVGYDEILRFYYGADIEHVVAEGPCVDGGPVDPGDPDDLEGGCGCGTRGSGGSWALALIALLAFRRRR